MWSLGMHAQSHVSVKKDSIPPKSKLEKGVTLQDVEVLGEHKFGIESSQMGAIRVTPQQLKVVPMFLGEPDVLKTLQKMPGVTNDGEGTVGIYVRGGNYDQNLITLDGVTLYNPEHLKGYASAINPDMVGGIDFYRGAFPARYGSRLSSVVDVTMKEGDFKQYHGTLFLGMLTGGLSVEGPIWKDRTSFIVGGRMSYFDLMAYPILKKVYDRPENLRPYSNMKYFDINAKISHKINDKHKLTFTFYYGKDTDHAQPTRTDVVGSITALHPITNAPMEFTSYAIRENATSTEWQNVCGALNMTNEINKRISLSFLAAYSKYNYSIKQNGDYLTKRETPHEEDDPEYVPLEEREPSLNEFIQAETILENQYSHVNDVTLGASMNWQPTKRHDIRLGGRINAQGLTPKTHIHNNYKYTTCLIKKTALGNNEYIFSDSALTYARYDRKHSLTQYAIFAEDDYTMNDNLKANFGVRFTWHIVTGKSYSSIEPRFSLRWKFLDKNALKLSYARMAQSVHRLSSNNIKSSIELWIPITKDIPLMTGDIYSLGYVYEPQRGISVSVEGYYKSMKNIIEYKNNASYATYWGRWDKLIAVGDGRTYGVELHAEKTAGNTTGWISYTWSKALRKFDHPGNYLNGGNEFYASNDRRHNLNIVLTHRFDITKKIYIEANAAWTYQTGRRGTIPLAQMYGGRLAEFDGVGTPFLGTDSDILGGAYKIWETYQPIMDNTHTFDQVRAAFSYRNMNDYVLPAVHHLDLNMNFSFKHALGQSIIGLSVYNVYNRLNVNTAYIGLNDAGEMVLKCQCPFPIMPSLSYTHKF